MLYCLRLLSALFIVSLTSLTHAAVVENIRSYRAPEYTRLVFDLSENIEFNVFTLENPQRVVVDLKDSILFDSFDDLDLGATPIVAIRSSIRNDQDLRVVFDIREQVQPRSFILDENEQYGNRLVVDFYDTTLPDQAYDNKSANITKPKTTLPTTPPVIKASSSVLENGQRDIIVAISAGHGGDDPGAVGVNKLQEKKVVLAISREIEALLARTPGYKPIMVREGDYYVNLRRRTEIAHDHNADLFIAIHADAYSTSTATGSTIYALSRKGATNEQKRRLEEKENGSDLIGGVGTVNLTNLDDDLADILLDLSLTASIASSLEVGEQIISSLETVTHMRRSTVEQAAFVVLKSADIPSLLIEAGYITNPHDAKKLSSSSHQRKFASAVVDGITSYFYSTPPRGSLVSWRKNHGSGPSSYTVKRGDNLSEIAERFNLSTNTLKNSNDLKSNTIRVGQVLTIPDSYASSAPAQVSVFEHTISRGETLSGIANSYSVSLRRIRETNQLNNDTIRIGQTLMIPSS